MGIRPSFKIIVGVDDVKIEDPRRVRKVKYEVIQELSPVFYADTKRDSTGDDIDPKLRKVFYGRNWDVLDDVLYNVLQHGEYAYEQVVGLIIENCSYDDIVLRALATIDKKYMNSGCMRIPTISPNEHQFFYETRGYTPNDVECNRFVPSVFENMPSVSRLWWKRAQFYLAQAGWDIPENQLRYLLVWDWS